jgi:hypothetical protein
LGGVVNESDLSILYPNGSILYLLGATNRVSIEDMRGLPIKKVYLDECQSFPEYIGDLIDDVLGPALMDHAGSLICIGTPGCIPAGYFYELTKNDEWSHHFWSFFNNPRLPFLEQGLTHQDILDRELKRRKVTIDHPSIQREWFGRWVLDTDSLVYHYVRALNDYDKLPGAEPTCILGIDIGYNDADALAVLGWYPQEGKKKGSPDTYLLEEAVTTKQDITELVKQIEDLRSRYDISKIVMDTGGLGKKIAIELGRRYKIPVEAADKSRKLEHIALLNDALGTSHFKARHNSRFANDCNMVEYDLDKSTPDKKIISKRFHSDICDAVLYAWVASYAFTYVAPTPAPKIGSPAWAKKEEQEMFEREYERLKRIEEGEESEFTPDDDDFGDFYS